MSVRNANKTSDPNDCYVSVENESNHNVNYYTVTKIPVFSLEEITHNDKWHTQQYLAANNALNNAKSRLESAKEAYDRAGITSSVQRFQIFWRCDWGKECNYTSSEKDNKFEQPERRYIQACDCDGGSANQGCSLNQSHIPLNVYSCYDEFTTASKSADAAAAEKVAASAEKVAAEVLVTQKNINAIQAKEQKDTSIGIANQSKVNGTYYPYAIYSGDRSTRPDKPYFIMLYNEGETLPKSYRAKPTGAGYLRYADDTSSHGCRIGGYVKNIIASSDSKSSYTDYILEARGTSMNEAQPQEVEVRQGAYQIMALKAAGRKDFPIDGAECRLKMESGLLNTDVTYFYSVGPVETPPVEIRSFSVSGNDIDAGKKTEVAPPCSFSQGNCLPNDETIPQDLAEKFKTGSITKRPRRTSDPQKTLDLIVGDGQNAHISLEWNTANAVNAKFTKREHFNIEDPPGKNKAVALTGANWKNRLDNRFRIDDRNPADEDVALSGKKEYDLRYGHCVIPSDGKEKCEPARYSFYFTARNDRAVGAEENMSVWLVAQRLDVSVKKKERDYAAEVGKCFDDGLAKAQDAADKNWAAQLACSGLGAASTIGVKALMGAATGGASVAEEAAAEATGGISTSGLLSNAVGGLVGGGCKTGVLLYHVNNYTKECNDIWVDPNANPAGAFWTGFAKGFFPGLFGGFLQSMLGDLFKKVSCVPWLDTLVKGLINFIGGTLGQFLGDLVSKVFGFDNTKISAGDKPLLVVGGTIGGLVGGTLGSVIEQSLGIGKKLRPAIDGLGKMFGATGSITNVSCEPPPEPKKDTPYYLCDPVAYTCGPGLLPADLVPPGMKTYSTADACGIECIKPKDKPEYYICTNPKIRYCQKIPIASPFAYTKESDCRDKCKEEPEPGPVPTTGVGCGCPFDKDHLTKSDAINRKSVVANAIQVASYVLTAEPGNKKGRCIPRKNAYECASLLYDNARPAFDAIFGASRTKGHNLNQKGCKEDPKKCIPKDPFFETIWGGLGASVGCGYTILPNIYDCEAEKTEAQCKTLPASDCGR